MNVRGLTEQDVDERARVPGGDDANAGSGAASLGRRGEDAALDVYRRHGFRLVARNWRCRLGEIDLVVRRGRLLVFCEVKARTAVAVGAGYEAMTWSKRRRLRRLAEVFLQRASERPAAVRFDVASVHAPSGRVPDVEIFQDAF
jgi:putative endonuclease